MQDTDHSKPHMICDSYLVRSFRFSPPIINMKSWNQFELSCSCNFFSSFSRRILFLADNTLRVVSFSFSVIFAQLATRESVPSLFTTIGPKLSSFTVEPMPTCVTSDLSDGAGSRSGVWGSVMVLRRMRLTLDRQRHKYGNVRRSPKVRERVLGLCH